MKPFFAPRGRSPLERFARAVLLAGVFAAVVVAYQKNFQHVIDKAAAKGTVAESATLFFLMPLIFAMLHDLSRGRPWRTPMLISIYVALVVMQAVLTPLLALAGLFDTLLGLRKRAAPPPAQS